MQNQQEGTPGVAVDFYARVHEAGGLDPALWPAERIKTICKMAAPDAKTIPQVAAFLSICERYGLDPILGQIFFADTGKGPKVLTGRDTFITVAEARPTYRGIANGVVMEGEECRIWRDEDDPHVVHIDHVIGFAEGDIVGAYCIAYDSERPPVIITRRWSDFEHLWRPNHKGVVKTNWKNHPKDMIENRCIAAALRRQYSLAGLLISGEEDSLSGPGDKARSVVDEQVDALRKKMSGDPKPTVLEAKDVWHPENVVLEGKHRTKSWAEVVEIDPQYIARIIKRKEILDADGLEALEGYAIAAAQGAEEAPGDHEAGQDAAEPPEDAVGFENSITALYLKALDLFAVLGQRGADVAELQVEGQALRDQLNSSGLDDLVSQLERMVAE